MDVEIYEESVCQLFGPKPNHSGKKLLRAEKDLPSTDEAKAAAFNEEIKPLLEGVTGA